MSDVSRSLIKLSLLAVLALGAWVGMLCYERQRAGPASRAEVAKAAAAEEAKDLKELAARLSAAPRRVAGILVAAQTEPTTESTTEPTTQPGTRPSTQPGDTVRTTLLFQEYAADGSTLPTKRFTIEGRTARVESIVLQFQGPFTKDREPLRGSSLPLFLRLIGGKQTPEAPESAHPIDDPGRTPAAYRSPEVAVTDSQRQLWREIWRLATDDAYRTRAGVRALQGQIHLGPLETGRLYTLTLNPDASLTATSAPLTPEALKMLQQDEEKVAPVTRPVTAP